MSWLASNPTLAGAAGAFAIAFSGILVRLSGASPTTAAFFRCLYALPALGVLAVLERRRYGERAPGQRRLALVAGVFFGLDLVFWHHSIENIGAGLATVLGNLQVVLVPIVAWLVLRERPGRRIAAAVPLGLLGVVLISGIFGQRPYGADPPLGVLYGVLTALAYSGFLLVLRAGNRDLRRPAGPLFDATLSSAVVALLAGWWAGDVRLEPTWPGHGWLILLALSAQVAGWLLISVSLPRVPAAVTSVVLTLQPVGAVVFSMLLIAETPSVLQLVGVAFILAGLVVGGVVRRPRAPAPAVAG
ncbi:MAG: DMT family transporter [Actinomycetota bacterium]|nr:DMT family transporter [Actinomycetota bacterium]